MRNEQRSYWVCATTRSGSSLLCEALRNTGLAGNPEEYFHKDDESGWFQRFGAATFAEYLPALFAQTSTPNGVFGAKKTMGGGYFAHFVANLRKLPQARAEMSVPELVHTAFPDLRYIWITRRNKVRQAVSWWKAVQTDQWAKFSGDSPPPDQVLEFKFDAIDHLVQEAVMREASWQEYFAACDVKPYVVVYEDFVGAYEETARAILDFLAITAPDGLVFGERRLQKQADSLSDEWVRRYRDLKQADWTAYQWEFMPDDG
jgi:LPS sulfotransferase NodH